VRQETGTGATPVSITETQYGACACSPLGKAVRVSLPHGPSETAVWTTYTYDGRGRTLTATAPDGGVTHYVYEGNKTTVTDPAGHWKAYTSDAFGNLTQVGEPNPDGGANLVTSYTYDGLNHLTQVTMTRQTMVSPPVYTTQTRSFNYDATTQRLTSAVNPENGTVTYAYNTDGSLNTRTDAKGQRAVYTYEALGRVDHVEYYDSNGQLDPCQTTWFVYDQTQVNYWGSDPYSLGRVTGVYKGGAGYNCQQWFGEEYAYSRGGLPVMKRQSVTIPNYAPANLDGYFSYDGEGRQTGYQVVTGETDVTRRPLYNYTFDSLGRPDRKSVV
jgi:YD repeat-containing protein